MPLPTVINIVQARFHKERWDDALQAYVCPDCGMALDYIDSQAFPGSTAYAGDFVDIWRCLLHGTQWNVWEDSPTAPTD